MKQKHTLFVLGISLLLIGLFIRLAIGRRRFNRRNAFGIQQFQSYDQNLVTRSGEGCAGLFANFLILAGILFMLAGLA
jgi:hypothetical protein